MKNQYIQPAIEVESPEFEMELMYPIAPSKTVDDGFAKDRESDLFNNNDVENQQNGWHDGLW